MPKFEENRQKLASCAGKILDPFLNRRANAVSTGFANHAQSLCHFQRFHKFSNTK
ncbi:MAG: hypothetical protein ACLFUS_09175 [Candidatus Sumerlaeia bacterium]